MEDMEFKMSEIIAGIEAEIENLERLLRDFKRSVSSLGVEHIRNQLQGHRAQLVRLHFRWSLSPNSIGRWRARRKMRKADHQIRWLSDLLYRESLRQKEDIEKTE